MSLPLSHPPPLLPHLRLSLWLLTGPPRQNQPGEVQVWGNRPPKIEAASRGAAEGDRQLRKGAPTGPAKSTFPAGRCNLINGRRTQR